MIHSPSKLVAKRSPGARSDASASETFNHNISFSPISESLERLFARLKVLLPGPSAKFAVQRTTVIKVQSTRQIPMISTARACEACA